MLAAAAAGYWLATGKSSPPGPDFAAVVAHARPFTSGPGLQVAPRFSRDGARVAYALGEGADSRIVVQAIDGASRQFIGSPGALRVSPVFFPDGRRIAFWEGTDGDCAIVEYDLDTAAHRRLVDCTMLPRVRFDLSPDGLNVVYSGSVRPDAPAGLWLVPTSGGAPRALTSPGAGDDLHPRFSPDGRAVAFFRGAEGHRQPWVVALDQPQSAHALTARAGHGFGLAWAGADGPLLVAADWFGERTLIVLDAATGEARSIGAPHARFPDVSVRGDLVYEDARLPGTGAERGARARIEEAGNVVDTPPAAQIDLMFARR